MANRINLYLVLVLMYISNTNEKHSKIYQKVNFAASMFHHIFSRVLPRGKSYNDILSRQNVEAFGYLLQQLPGDTVILALSYNSREKLPVYR